ncbi:MAG: hypothetical protein ACP5SH_04805 [Syntrophobacteraceae bacterium]
MPTKAADVGEVSWRLFNELYESQYDLLRKLEFITKAGKLNGCESIALELIDGYLKQKESELKELRQAALAEWTGRKHGFGAQSEEKPEAQVPAGVDK